MFQIYSEIPFNQKALPQVKFLFESQQTIHQVEVGQDEQVVGV